MNVIKKLGELETSAFDYLPGVLRIPIWFTVALIYFSARIVLWLILPKSVYDEVI